MTCGLAWEGTKIMVAGTMTSGLAQEGTKIMVAGVLQRAAKMGCWWYNCDLVLRIVVLQVASHELH
jgi:hypothetical protein